MIQLENMEQRIQEYQQQVVAEYRNRLSSNSTDWESRPNAVPFESERRMYSALNRARQTLDEAVRSASETEPAGLQELNQQMQSTCATAEQMDWLERLYRGLESYQQRLLGAARTIRYLDDYQDGIPGRQRRTNAIHGRRELNRINQIPLTAENLDEVLESIGQVRTTYLFESRRQRVFVQSRHIPYKA